ncbi:hypothetical protein AB1Y20_012328 [Prymnesium parvum]|uniref:Uncharacterized protein n=1 Tax=Prymnesium parvum TaxID=97485 RepID=A0AB34IQX3_PRYPA
MEDGSTSSTQKRGGNRATTRAKRHAHSSWKERCVETWGLTLPEDNADYNDDVWKCYHRERSHFALEHKKIMKMAVDGDEECAWPQLAGDEDDEVDDLPSHVEAATNAAASCLQAENAAVWNVLKGSAYVTKAEWEDDGNGRPRSVELECIIYSTYSPCSLLLYVGFHDRAGWDTYDHYERGLMLKRGAEALGHPIDEDATCERLFSCVSSDTAKYGQDDGAPGRRLGEDALPGKSGNENYGSLSPMSFFVVADHVVQSAQELLVPPGSRVPIRLWWRFLLAVSGMQVLTEACGTPTGWLHQLIHLNTPGDETTRVPYLLETVPEDEGGDGYDMRRGDIDGAWRQC